MKQGLSKFSATHKKALLTAALAGATITGASLAMAQTGQTGAANQTARVNQAGPYLGGGVGMFKSRGGEFDDDNSFFELVGGYKFNQFFALEGAYINFGEYGGSVASASVDGWRAAAIGSFPVTPMVNLYAKGGILFSNVDVEVVGFDDSYSDEQFFVGLGVNFAVMDPLSVSVEYNRYRIDVDDSNWPGEVDSSNTDIDTLSLGVKFHF